MTVCGPCEDEAEFDAVTMDVTSWVDGGADEAVEVDVAMDCEGEDVRITLDERLVVVLPPPAEETVVDDLSDDCDDCDNGVEEDDMMASERR